MTSKFTIREASIEEVVQLSTQIPEFIAPHGVTEYQERLTRVPSLVLVAYNGKDPVGFKVGYEREKDGSFYSWMGAILPNYRSQGVAKLLANHQETWAVSRGYQCIRFKTRNRLKAMLLFSLKNGFNIVGIEQKPTVEEHRIILEKEL